MSNTFRKQYRKLTSAEKARVEHIKNAAEQLEALILSIPTDLLSDQTRMWQTRLALTNLEQAVMWAVKAAT
jgi:hypothetical protein